MNQQNDNDPDRQQDVPESPGESSPEEPAAGGEILVSADEWSDLEARAQERDVYRNELLRAKADLDNYQKRMRRERPALEERAADGIVRKLLPVIDDFERALGAMSQEGASLEAVAEGIRITYQSLLKVLEEIGVEEIPALGEDFNPEVHEAVLQEDTTDRRNGEVTDVLQKGYQKKGTVLRPSKVKVARNVSS